MSASQAMADAIDGAQLVDHSRRRSLAAVREPARLDRRADRVSSRRCPRRRSSAPWKRTAAGSRSRCCSATTSTRCSRCRAGISSCSTTARCRPGSRLVDVRHEQTRDVRGRRLGEGHAPARLRGAHRRTGRHQRRERDDRGADERLADGRAGRARAAGALGRRLAAGARPRADRRVGHEDGRDRDLGRVDRRRGRCRVPRRPHAAPRPDVRRHPARRVRARRRRAAGRRQCRRGSGRDRPTPTRSRASPTLVGDGAAAGAGRRRRRVLGARARTPMRAFVEAARSPGVRERHGPRARCRPTTSSRSRAPGRSR